MSIVIIGGQLLQVCIKPVSEGQLHGSGNAVQRISEQEPE